MKRVLLFVAFCWVCVPGRTWAVIVYSGSQNVTVGLGGGGAPAPMSTTVCVGTPGCWGDFTIGLQYENTMGIGSPSTFLTIVGNTGMGGSIGQVLEYSPMGGMVPPGLALNLMAGDPIGSGMALVDPGVSALLSQGSGGSTILGQFGASGGYVGLALPGSHDPYYGWLHVVSISNLGDSNARAVIDGWAYDDVQGQPIRAGDTGGSVSTPAPSALVLGGLGVALLLRWRRPRTA